MDHLQLGTHAKRRTPWQCIARSIRDQRSSLEGSCIENFVLLGDNMQPWEQGGLQTNMRTWRPYQEGFLIVGYQLFTSSRMDMPMAVPVIKGTPMLATRERELPIQKIQVIKSNLL